MSSGEEDKLDSEDDGTDLACGGGHINDVLNQPDEQGRVQVNIGHDSEDPDIFLASQISKAVKPHQVSKRSQAPSKGHRHFVISLD